MQMKKYKLGDIATLEISGVDKKMKDGEEDIRLCNFVDVYYNWAITMARHDSFMLATARPNEISKFQLRKGQVALTKDSETRDDIGISTYIANDFDDVILGYHCALITPNKDILDVTLFECPYAYGLCKEIFRLQCLWKWTTLCVISRNTQFISCPSNSIAKTKTNWRNILCIRQKDRTQ